jgi:hypothetical protein
MTSSRNEPPTQSKDETDAEWTGTRTSAGGRRSYIGWIVLAVYSLLLVGRALHHGIGSQTAGLGLWELQDSRRLLGWIGGLVLAAFCESACFLPVGFVAAIAVPRRSGRLGRFPIQLPALVIASSLAVLLYAVEIAWSWDSAAVLGLVFPLLGGLLGTWMGATWLRGRRARLWFVPKAALSVVLAALCAGILVWLLLEPEPLPFEAAHVTSAEKRRLVDLLRGKDPTSLEEGRTHSLRLTEHDLNVLLAWGLSLGPLERKAQVGLARELALLSVSARVPLGTEEPRYLNLAMTGCAGVEDGVLRLEVDRCQVGPLEVPRWLLRSVVPIVTSRLGHDRRAKPFLDATRQMVIEPGSILLTYGPLHLPPELRRDLFGPAAAGEEVLASTQAQIDRLLAVAGQPPHAQPSFGLCLETVFALARDRSIQGDPAAENKAGIFALGVLLGHPRVGELLGSVSAGDEDSAARRALYRVALRGRSDWTKHFCVSAVIAILSDEAVSGAAGLLKEELDADTGGSGFSFADLLADRAGTTFAVWATRDETAARAMQNRLAGGFRVDDFFPLAADLPEGIPDAQLQSRYGGVGGEAYRRLIEEIERRIAACAAYR